MQLYQEQEEIELIVRVRHIIVQTIQHHQIVLFVMELGTVSTGTCGLPAFAMRTGILGESHMVIVVSVALH